MERKTNSASHQKIVNSGPVLKRDYATDYAAGQGKDRRDSGYNCKRGLESVRYQRVRIDNQVCEHPESHTSKFAESAREKTRDSSSERACLHYDSCDQPRYERSHFWDGGAKNQVD